MKTFHMLVEIRYNIFFKTFHIMNSPKTGPKFRKTDIVHCCCCPSIASQAVQARLLKSQTMNISNDDITLALTLLCLTIRRSELLSCKSNSTYILKGYGTKYLSF